MPSGKFDILTDIEQDAAELFRLINIYIDLVLIITEIFMYMTKRLSAAVNQSIFREPTLPK